MFFSWKSIKVVNSDFVLVCSVSRSQCYQLVYLMFLANRWLNFIAQNVLMLTHQNHLNTITQMALILAPAFHTCSSWYIQITDQNDQQTNSLPDCMVSKFILKHIQSNSKLLLIALQLLFANVQLVNHQCLLKTQLINK
jgi:hypothetical protein